MRRGPFVRGGVRVCRKSACSRPVVIVSVTLPARRLARVGFPRKWILVHQNPAHRYRQRGMAMNVNRETGGPRWQSQPNAGARGWLWGALFAIWTVWAWWALLVAAVVCAALYYGSLVPAARSYGDLVYAAFALHRFDLYARCTGRRRRRRNSSRRPAPT